MNEAESLETLYCEIATVADHAGWDAEILFIDDGSSDDTWRTIESLARIDPRVRGIRFRRNFGKAAGLAAGFSEAEGEVVFTLDADLQDNPAEMPRMLAKLDEGYDLVSGWKRTRHDPWHKVFPSHVWNAAVSRLSGVHLHDHNCGFKAYHREVTREVDLYGEFHRYVPLLAHARGFRVAEVEVEHRARHYGVSKYGARRFLRGCVDLLTVLFLTRAQRQPAHFLGGWGVALLGIGALCQLARVLGPLLGASCGADDASTHVCMGSTLSWLAVVLATAGANLIGLGILAQLVLAHPSGGAGQYAIAERTASHPSGGEGDA